MVIDRIIIMSVVLPVDTVEAHKLVLAANVITHRGGVHGTVDLHAVVFVIERKLRFLMSRVEFEVIFGARFAQYLSARRTEYVDDVVGAFIFSASDFVWGMVGHSPISFDIVLGHAQSMIPLGFSSFLG